MFFKVLLLILLFHSFRAENSDENIEGSGTDLSFPQRCESSDDCTIIDTDCVLGECVFTESVECPSNMHYSECLMKCSKTCQKLNETNSCLELEHCSEGCECNDGYLWDNDEGICITFQLCEQKTLEDLNEMEVISASCPEFSAYDACPNKCGAKTCENLEKKCDKKGCGPKQCTCRYGFVQASDNIADGCIPIDECTPVFPPTTPDPLEEEEGSGESPGGFVELAKSREGHSNSCPIHSNLKDCVPIVPINCYTANTGVVTPSECGHQRCECIDGYVRADSGEDAPCIPITKCQIKHL
uniref:TIL domain-containing protein n=1 Tax=Panagrolaimus superbus TaxID=310955 RepID=A0A914YCU1_9BILA